MLKKTLLGAAFLIFPALLILASCTVYAKDREKIFNGDACPLWWWIDLVTAICVESIIEYGEEPPAPPEPPISDDKKLVI